MVEGLPSSLFSLLQEEGYMVIGAQSLGSALAMFNSYLPELVLIDPDCFDGGCVHFLLELRKTSLVPVIFVSADGSEEQKVFALDSGANDYIVKPYGSRELAARLRAALRQSRFCAESARVPGGKFELGALLIDYDTRRVFVGENEIDLTQTEYNILAFLSENSGRLMPYSAIIKAIWGYSYAGSVKKLQVNVANIRKKLGKYADANSCIINEPGVGYRI